MKVGTKVLYNDELYTIIHIYGNGQIEIKKDDGLFLIKLVDISEVKQA